MPRFSALILASRSGANVALIAWACGGNASTPANSEATNRAPNDGAGGSNINPGMAPGGGVSTGPVVPPAGPPGGVPNELIELESAVPQPEPFEGVCPAGSRAIVPEDCAVLESAAPDGGTSDAEQLDKRGFRPPPCTCEYVCAPGCGTGEVCAPETPDSPSPTCSCHPALDRVGDGCVWTRFVADGAFDGTSSDGERNWRLWTSGVEGASRAAVEGGRLELEVSSRCAYAWAGAVARVPARGALAQGVALVFDYSASGGPQDFNTGVRVSLNGLTEDRSIPFTSAGTERRCVTLYEDPSLAMLQFEVSVYGTCGESPDYRLTVDNVRLEPDPLCP